jgi:hypothetical protein
LHRIFEEQKDQIENSVASQLRKEFTATNEQLREENVRLKTAKKELEEQIESAATSTKKLGADLGGGSANVQRMVERVEAAHTIRERLEQDAVALKEVRKRLEKPYKQSQREKTGLKEVNRQLRLEKRILEQVNRQSQEEKMQLANAHRDCGMKIRTLKRRNFEKTCGLEEQAGYVRMLEKSDELLRGDSKEFQVGLQDLEKELEVERNFRIEIEQSKDLIKQQTKKEATNAKDNEEKLNHLVQQLREAAILIREKSGTDRANAFELSKDKQKL